MNQTKAVVLLSGGLDSSVLLYDLQRRGYDVLPLAVNYGQRHGVEIFAAADVASSAARALRVADLSALRPLLAGSSQTDDDVPVPDGHYTDPSMRATVVPNRNMLLLSVATAYAVSMEAKMVAYAAHAGDHPIYPDCRPQFIARLADAIELCHYEGQTPVLHAPFAHLPKAEIVRRGAELGVLFALTWSCYKGGARHCGTCGTCVERKEAFQLAGVDDPTPYAA